MRDPRTLDEAMEHGWLCLKYFLKFHPKKTILVLLVMFGSGGYVLNDYIGSDRVKVEKAVPKSETANFSIMSKAFAQELVNKNMKIVVDKQYFGMVDTNFVCYVIKDEGEIFIYDKVAGVPYQIKAPFLNRMRAK